MRTAEQAAKVAEATYSNHEGWCQLVVRGYYEAPSAGDYDGDGAADAEDGWKKEPASARHTDKKGRRGCPASFLGGRNDNGHRAIFVDDYTVRSTDFDGRTKTYRSGVVGNGTVDEVARAMNVTYVGWSTTINGLPISSPAPAPAPTRVQRARRLLTEARIHARANGHERRARRIQRALNEAPLK